MSKQCQFHGFLWFECDVVLAELSRIHIGNSKQDSVVKNPDGSNPSEQLGEPVQSKTAEFHTTLKCMCEICKRAQRLFFIT